MSEETPSRGSVSDGDHEMPEKDFPEGCKGKEIPKNEFYEGCFRNDLFEKFSFTHAAIVNSEPEWVKVSLYNTCTVG